MTGDRRPGRKRGAAAGEPQQLAEVLGPVVDRLGGALTAGEPGIPQLEEIIGTDLAQRTNATYRDGELTVAAATNADATLLGYERNKLAKWAQEAFSLGVEPRVRVVVGRGPAGSRS